MQNPAQRRELSDGGSGLYLICQPSGIKSFAIRYRASGAQQRVTLGRYPDLALVDARAEARSLLEAADKRAAVLAQAPVLPALLNAPVALALPAPAVDTVALVWADYCRLHLANTASVGKFGSAMKAILPLWNDRPVSSITKRDCIAVIDAALARGPEAQNSTHVALGSYFGWCFSRDIVSANPMAGIKKIKQPSRERFLNDKEIGLFWNGCAEIPVFGSMFRLLLLTGCRLGEVSKMKWSEIENRVWHLPSSRTKTKKPLDVHLTETMLSILATIPQIGEFVFSVNGGRSYATSDSQAKADLDKLAPIPDFQLRDLRRTFATGISKLGVSGPVIERCLSHSIPGVAGIYDRYDFAPEMAAAWGLWSEHVAKITMTKK
jgi:hypothetical protein